MTKEDSAFLPSILLVAAASLTSILAFFVFVKWLKSTLESTLESSTTEDNGQDYSTTKKQRGSYNADDNHDFDDQPLKERKGRKKAGQDKGKPQRFTKAAYAHPWLVTTLKAHSASILDVDFSANKKFLATCAEDRTVMLWNIKDFNQRDHKFLRVNVDFDYATRVKWSPDSKAFVICRHTNLDLQVYKVNKKPDGGLSGAQWAHTFPAKLSDDIVGMGIASTGKYLMTCSANTNLIVWSLKGELLASIDTHQVNAYFASVSPCGRFVASCGFTSDVKVWQVVFDKTGEFKEVARAFELKGHAAGVDRFAFSDDSSRMATISKDKTWKLWDTKIEFDKGQEPYLLLTVPCPDLRGGSVLLSLSPDARVVAVADGDSVRLYSGISGGQERVIDNEGPVSCMTFDPFSKYLLLATEKHVRVFHNVVGLRIGIQELEERRKLAVNQSMKERIQQQIAEARSSLDAIGEN